MKPIVLLFTLALTGCGGGSSSDESPTNSSKLGKSKNGFNLVTSSYLLTNCPVATNVSTSGWYQCLKGTSFTGYVDLFDKKYCEIAVGNDGEFHYITETEHLTTVNAANYLLNNSLTGIYSLSNSDALGLNLSAMLSSNFDYSSKFSDFSMLLIAYSNRFYSTTGNKILHPSQITIYQKSSASTTTVSRKCYINSLD